MGLVFVASPLLGLMSLLSGCTSGKGRGGVGAASLPAVYATDQVCFPVGERLMGSMCLCVYGQYGHATRKPSLVKNLMGDIREDGGTDIGKGTS